MEILRGTFESFSDVIVDSTNKLISTAYHSNSGGMTEDAYKIWQVKLLIYHPLSILSV